MHHDLAIATGLIASLDDSSAFYASTSHRGMCCCLRFLLGKIIRVHASIANDLSARVRVHEPALLRAGSAFGRLKRQRAMTRADPHPGSRTSCLVQIDRREHRVIRCFEQAARDARVIRAPIEQHLYDLRNAHAQACCLMNDIGSGTACF